MKSSSPALRALLATRSFDSASCYTFSAVDGTVLRYTQYDRDITANGNLFKSGGATGLIIERGDQQGSLCSWKRGLQVDTLQFDVLPRQETVNGIPFLTVCRNGFFDGAEVTLERAYMPVAGDTSAGTVIMFVGRVGELDAGRTAATFHIVSHLELLNQNMPRELYMPSCPNALFDINCGLSRGAYAVPATVAIGSTAAQLVTALTNPTGYFDLGTIVFSSGLNSGCTRSIKSYASGTFSLASPLPYAPAPGNAFTALPGCDKTAATCAAKFHNSANFRGFPTIPRPETAV